MKKAEEQQLLEVAAHCLQLNWKPELKLKGQEQIAEILHEQGI